MALEVHHGLDGVTREWRQFESVASGTLYQSALWCEAWMDTVGAATGASAVIVAGREAGRLRFILPLQIRTRQRVRVLEWLGAPQHAYGCPVIHSDFMPRAGPWFEAHFADALAMAGPVDAICLTENPHSLFGRTHPLLPHFNLRGANPSFTMALEQDFETFYRRKRSSDRRRNSRRAETGLSKMGDLRFGLPRDKAAGHALLKTMFGQLEERLAERGVHQAFGPDERAFVHRLIDRQDDAHPILAPFQLTLDGEVLAVKLGGIHNGVYWALIASLASGPVRKFSPGEVALRQSVQACCERGFSGFDFAVGDADYKRQWADETIELSTVLQACNLKGLAWASAMALQLSAKQWIKRTPWLRDAGYTLRQTLLGRSVRP